MNEERLTAVLASLRHERIERTADQRIRARLEEAWAQREPRAPLTVRLRQLAPVLATVALFGGLLAATMNASGESALYGIRVAIEDAAVLLHADPEDRREYLLALLDQRQAEAARLESSGDALAASRVREIEQSTLRQLEASLPPRPEDSTAAAPTASDSPSPTPSPTASPSPSPSPVATPNVATGTATPTPRPTATPARTPTPTPPQPTGAPFLVTLTGTVKNPDLTLADGACVSIALPADLKAPCDTKTVQGTYRFAISGRLNQTITVYAWRYDAASGLVYRGYSSATIHGATVQMPDIKLLK